MGVRCWRGLQAQKWPRRPLRRRIKTGIRALKTADLQAATRILAPYTAETETTFGVQATEVKRGSRMVLVLVSGVGRYALSGGRGSGMPKGEGAAAFRLGLKDGREGRLPNVPIWKEMRSERRREYALGWRQGNAERLAALSGGEVARRPASGGGGRG